MQFGKACNNIVFYKNDITKVTQSKINYKEWGIEFITLQQTCKKLGIGLHFAFFFTNFCGGDGKLGQSMISALDSFILSRCGGL